MHEDSFDKGQLQENSVNMATAALFLYLVGDDATLLSMGASTPYFTFAVACTVVMYFFGEFLSSRQRNVIRTASLPSELDGILKPETFEKARIYSLDKSTYGLVYGVYGFVDKLLCLVYGFLPFVWRASGSIMVQLGLGNPVERPFVHAVMFMVLTSTADTIMDMPWDLYSTFVLEEKHGFNKQTLGFYFKDQIKKFAVSQVLSNVVFVLLLTVIDWAGENFFFYAWLLVLVVSVVLYAVYADFIAPLFDSFTPLPEGELRDKIEALAKRLSFPLKKLYVVDGSTRSSHSNAYFYGFFNNKRIVLFDTLLPAEVLAASKAAQTTNAKPDAAPAAEPDDTLDSTEESSKSIADSEETKEKESLGCTIDEVVAVLAHELGHWSHNHVFQGFVLGQVNMFILFYMFGQFARNAQMYAEFGFTVEDNMPIIIGLIIVFNYLLSPYSFAFGFFMTLRSQRHEYQADRFAKDLGYADMLKDALVKLSKQNLGFPVADWLYSTFTHSHPIVVDRLRALDGDSKKLN